MTRDAIEDLFDRLLEEKGRVYPEELNRLLADAGHEPATRDEMYRAAGLATDLDGMIEQLGALRAYQAHRETIEQLEALQARRGAQPD